MTVDLAVRPPNAVLQSMSDADYAGLRPHIRQLVLAQGDVLFWAGGKITQAYFPHGSVVSFTVPLSVGEMVEIGMIGHDGVVDSSAAPDETALNSGVVQIGGPATAIDLRTLRMLADQSRALRILLCQQKLFMFAQAQQSVACIAKHVIEERLCSKLLRSFELAENPVLPLTHEFLAQMLGVRRTSITLAVGRLDRAGLIDHRRGRIRIVDPEGLRKAACECYEAVKADMTSLLAATHLASY